jgi:tetratricopeptide (TPR) repeat protein
MVAVKKRTMRRQGRGCLWCFAAFAVTLCLAPHPAAIAKDSGSVQNAVKNARDEDPKAALITLKNAIRKSPQDALLHLKIARLYFRLGDSGSAEHEARAARDLNGDEADYLPLLLDAMLVREEFKEIYDLVEPGDRDLVLESKVRTALGTAAVRLGYDTRAETLLRDAIKLDPSVVEPRIRLARFLSGTRPEETCSTLPAPPPPTIRPPGSSWSPSTSCGVIGRAPRPLPPSFTHNFRET